MFGVTILDDQVLEDGVRTSRSRTGYAENAVVEVDPPPSRMVVGTPEVSVAPRMVTALPLGSSGSWTEYVPAANRMVPPAVTRSSALEVHARNQVQGRECVVTAEWNVRATVVAVRKAVAVGVGVVRVVRARVTVVGRAVTVGVEQVVTAGAHVDDVGDPVVIGVGAGPIDEGVPAARAVDQIAADAVEPDWSRFPQK